MNSCVLDASVIARWWLTDQNNEQLAACRSLRAALGTGELEAHVPDLAFNEVANTLWKAARFSDWTAAGVRTAVADLIDLPLVAHESREYLRDAVALALDHTLTVYDASYVGLAKALELPLFTADRKLIRAAPLEHVHHVDMLREKS
jgi:predicted nucleic acid-binding protein